MEHYCDPDDFNKCFYQSYKLLARLRNGIETVMSVSRSVYHVDTMPVRGLGGRLFFGFKIGALRADRRPAAKLCTGKSIASRTFT